MSSQPILLHTTAPLSPLPSSDPESLYLAGVLQLSFADKWAITIGDWGVNGGVLPYITHLDHLIDPSHLSSLPGYIDPDEGLTEQEKVDSLCCKVYIEQTIEDLVNHTLYSLPPNYPETIAKSHLTNLSFPQTHYIPQRIKSLVRSRLEHVGLWGLAGLNAGDAAAEDRKRLDDQYVVGPAGTLAPRAWSGWTAGRDVENRRKKWGEQELKKKIKSALDPLVRRLGDETYFFGDRPTTLDIALFAQLTLILSTTLPNPLFAELLRASYPTLVSHHDRLLARLFPTSESWTSVRRISPPSTKSDSTYLGSISSWWSGKDEGEKKNKAKTSKEKSFERGRWLWFAGATVTMITYLFVSGMVQLDFGTASDSDAEDGNEDESEEESDGESIVVVEDDEED